MEKFITSIREFIISFWEKFWIIDSSVDILNNILADIFAASLLLLLGWFLLSRRRRKLHRFFGIKRNKPLLVYLSAMKAEKNTLIDRYDQTTQHEGIVISDYEFQTILPVSNLFLSDSIGTLPYMMAEIANQATVVKKPTIKFAVSPKRQADLEFGSMISIGSHIFNAATAYYWSKTLSNLRLYLDPKSDKWTFQRLRGQEIVRTISPEEVRDFKDEDDKWNIGIITKSIDIEHDATVFIVAGTGKNGTRAAVNYLIERWTEFEKQFKDQEFGVAIKCIKYPFDPKGYEDPKEIGRWIKTNS